MNATIPVGFEPLAVAVNRNTRVIYVPNEFSNTVSVISGRTNEVNATIPVGADPRAVAVNPDTKTAYVVNEPDNTVSVLSSCRR